MIASTTTIVAQLFFKSDAAAGAVHTITVFPELLWGRSAHIGLDRHHGNSDSR
jgi:hypothetical protein